MTGDEICDWIYANAKRIELKELMVFVFWTDDFYNDHVTSGFSVRQAVEKAIAENDIENLKGKGRV